MRLDAALVARGLAVDLRGAQAEVIAGNVLVDETPAVKASDSVTPDQQVRLRSARARFVSRGGDKLQAALDQFGVPVTDRVAADLGASTGGFTDCLLQAGAARVYAVDVGYNQLDWRLRSDPRVVVMERTNARDLKGLAEPVSLVVGDVSFISLARILPAVKRLLVEAGDAILLIKPQFEVERGKIEAGGRLRDPAARSAAIERVLAEAVSAGFEVAGVMESPVPGAKARNIEALVWLRPVTTR